MSTVARSPAALPAAAAAVFGEWLALAVRYAELLSTAGVERGLLGPAEATRLWERHLLNCAVVAELVPPAVEVLDLGSGAGLPGIPLALARPDLSVVLLEPLERRTSFLAEVVGELGLDRRVRIVRDRAEKTTERAAVVTARAVAPLHRLVGWSARLLSGEDPQVLAIKGRSAQAEVTDARADLRRSGLHAEVLAVGSALLEDPTTVIRLTRTTP